MPAIASLLHDLRPWREDLRRCRADCASDAAMHGAVAAISSSARGFVTLTLEFLTLSQRDASLIRRWLALIGWCGHLFGRV